jgi:hypothetical protein
MEVVRLLPLHLVVLVQQPVHLLAHRLQQRPPVRQQQQLRLLLHLKK